MGFLKGYHTYFGSIFRTQYTKKKRICLWAIFLCTLISTARWVYDEVAFATQMISFEYPLNIDMKHLMEDFSDGKVPRNIKPLNQDLDILIENKQTCFDENGKDLSVLLLIVVKSKMDNFDHRAAIRETWGSKNNKYNAPVRVVFLLGTRPKNREFQQRVLSEHEVNQDIIQGNFIDDYYNNTLKLLVGLQWATTRCPDGRYVAFVDDDFFVAPQKIINKAVRLKYNKFMFGNVIRKALPFRNSFSKWVISEEEYSYKFWPPYLLGGCFLTPILTARDLSIASLYTKFLRFDDVFLGIVAHKLGIRLVHEHEIYPQRLHFSGMKETGHSVLAVHGYSPSELRVVWKEYLDVIST